MTEAKYLNVDNTDRYRPIMRLFYLKYEKLKYWLYQEEVYEQLKQIYEELRQSYQGKAEPENQKNWDICLIGDPHLQKEENQEFVKAQVQKGAAVIITGRVKPGHLPELLLKEEKAIKQLYPHHL